MISVLHLFLLQAWKHVWYLNYDLSKNQPLFKNLKYEDRLRAVPVNSYPNQVVPCQLVPKLTILSYCCYVMYMRPLKVVLASEDHKERVLRVAKNLKRSGVNGLERVFIHQDLTPKHSAYSESVVWCRWCTRQTDRETDGRQHQRLMPVRRAY